MLSLEKENNNGQDPVTTTYEQRCHADIYQMVKDKLCDAHMTLCLSKLAAGASFADIDAEELRCTMYVVASILQIKAEIELERD